MIHLLVNLIHGFNVFGRFQIPPMPPQKVCVTAPLEIRVGGWPAMKTEYEQQLKTCHSRS